MPDLHPSEVDAEVVHLSYSGLSTYRTCGEQYRLLKIKGVQGRPGVYNCGGTAVHAMTEALDWKRFDPDQAVLTYDEYFDQAVAEQEELSGFKLAEFKVAGKVTKATPNKDDVTWWRQNGPGMVRSWTNWINSVPFSIAISPNGEPAIELSIEPVFGIVPSKGFIDRVLVSDSNPERFVVCDIKSGKPPKDNLQLAVYAEALTQDGWDVWHGGYWMARGGILSGINDLSPLMGGRLVYEFEQAWKGIHTGVFPAKPSGLCKDWCDANKFCYAGGVMTDATHLPFPTVGGSE